MKLEEVIIKAGIDQKVKIAKLYKPAVHCSSNPDTGVNGEVDPRALNVIKDCAIMTSMYLPIDVFSKLKDPIGSIKGVDDITIKEFAKKVSDNEENSRLLYSMIFEYVEPIANPKANPQQLADVYGDYTSLVNRKLPMRKLSYDFEAVVNVLKELL
jgi:hypothetical protein